MNEIESIVNEIIEASDIPAPPPSIGAADSRLQDLQDLQDNMSLASRFSKEAPEQDQPRLAQPSPIRDYLQDIDDRLRDREQQKKAERDTRREDHLSKLEHSELRYFLDDNPIQVMRNIVGYHLMTCQHRHEARKKSGQMFMQIDFPLLFGKDEARWKEIFRKKIEHMERRQSAVTVSNPRVKAFLPFCKRNVIDHVPESRRIYNRAKGHILAVEYAHVLKTITQKVLQKWNDEYTATVVLANAYFTGHRPIEQRTTKKGRNQSDYPERYYSTTRRRLGHTKLSKISKDLHDAHLIIKSPGKGRANGNRFQVNHYRIGKNNYYQKYLCL